MPDKTLGFSFSVDRFNNFKEYLKELYTIDNTIIMVVDNQDTILYSFVGKDLGDVHAFKSLMTKTDDFINKKRDIEERFIFIIKDGKKFVRNINNFMEYNEELSIKVSIDDDGYVNYMGIQNSKLKLKEIGGDAMVISKQITKSDIIKLTDKTTSLFNFDISENDFNRIRNMSMIESTNDVLYINIKEKSLSIGENKWDLKICDIDKPNISISFPKKYFNTLKFKSDTKIYVFENYILLSDKNSDLMIVLETTI